MKYKINDVLVWDGADGILQHGKEYVVCQTREGFRGQEFILKHKDWQMIDPVIWWEAGKPFIKPIATKEKKL
jgi:hypothetical protein